jgi:UDP-N-acetylmuramoylalanine--D-glutamate ligase
MIDLKKYKNKKIAIYGMGKTGFSVANTFKNLKAKIYCWDDNKKIRKKVKKNNLILNKFWKKNSEIDLIVVSPGIDILKCKIKKYLRNNSNKIITDLDIFFELKKKSVIVSITGTNGKSTTCKIIEKILKTAKYKVKTIGNIGNPILSTLTAKKETIFIIEVSSYQLQYSKLFRSNHAAILNISPDHLERHQNINNYIKIKSKIFLAQKKSDFSYLNASNKYSKKIKEVIKKNKIKSKLFFLNKSKYDLLLKSVHNSYFKSKGNIENLIFAYQITKNLNINEKIIIKALNNFKGLPHRQEIILSQNKLLCINDSKATSFDASFQSLSAHNKIYWIVGGLPKYKDYFYLKDIKKKIVKAYIVGSSISFFKKQLKNKVHYTVSKDIKTAINDIYDDLKLNKSSSKTILLSPAAASFDQFINFENRGIYFRNLILKKFKKK